MRSVIDDERLVSITDGDPAQAWEPAVIAAELLALRARDRQRLVAFWPALHTHLDALLSRNDISVTERNLFEQVQRALPVIQYRTELTR